jgi:hypothetical protein
VKAERRGPTRPCRASRVVDRLTPAAHALTAAVALAAAGAAAGQTSPPPDRDGGRQAQPADAAPEVVVVGRRGEVRTDVEPLATFDARAIAASGATSVGELLRTIRGVTQSADGQEPILLLNAQRVSGYQEIGNLPPEAIEKVDVLPEPVALRYGYPPTRRVVNFVTKRRFRQLALRPALGTSTRGGADMANAHADLTRLRGDGRVTVSLDARHTDALPQSRRRIRPNPDVPFDAIGNVTGIAGGEIDPGLSALAGQVVTIAPVPAGSATLAGFATGANQPRLFDLSPFRTLAPANDTFHGEAVVANRIGRTLSGSLTVTADHSHDVTLFGPASATLTVPAGNPRSPFASDVLLQRYLTEAPPLGQRSDTTTLHAGGVLRGAVGGWQWDLTGTLDAQRRTGTAGTAIDVGPADAAIAAGADSFRPLDPALLGNRLVDHSVQVSHGAGAKLVATKRPLRLPAGQVTLTASAEVERTSSDARTTGADQYAVAFARTRVEGQVAVDVPIASRREEVLAWAGDLSANASVAVRRVGGFGTLSDVTGGLTWSPLARIQLLAQVKRSAAAPMLDQLASPQASSPQVPLFDFATGRSTLVTLLVGGNPALAAEQRLVRSLGVTVKPFAAHELRVGLSYDATRIGNGIQTVYALTPTTEAGLPDLFVRDAAGGLATVTFRPTNIFRESRHTIGLTLNANGQLGHAKPPATPGGSPPERPSFYGGIGPSLALQDRVMLRAGGPALDLLAGDTLSGGITPRWSGYGYGGINYLGNGGAFDIYCTGGGLIVGAVAASTLAFAPLCTINVNGSLSLHHFLPRQAWTKHLGLKLEIANLSGAQQQVHDAAGTVPYRYQPDLLTPLGRTLTLSLRKLF